jgi:hypothetical protein
MKLHITCRQCPTTITANGSVEMNWIEVEERDDGIYRVNCNAGHSVVTIQSNLKYEILFDNACKAILDGYLRDGVTTIAAALERFYEFYIRVICFKHGVDHDSLTEAWKVVKSQSERQLGAYIFCYLIDHPKSIPAVIDKSTPKLENISVGQTKTWTAFRNNVVHNGFIPSPNETNSYCELVYFHILELIDDLQKNSKEALEKTIENHQETIKKKARESSDTKSIPYINITSAVSIDTETIRFENFQDVLRFAEEGRHLMTKLTSNQSIL